MGRLLQENTMNILIEKSCKEINKLYIDDPMLVTIYSKLGQLSDHFGYQIHEGGLLQ